MYRIICEGVGLGLSTGVYCIGACLPFFAPYVLSEGKPRIIDNLYTVLVFMSGRLLAYVLFSIAVSFFGILVKTRISPRVTDVALLLTSLIMIIYALVRNFPGLKFCGWLNTRFSMQRVPFLLGFLIGLNLCPPFLVGMVRLVEMGNIFSGVLFFFSFFMGTSFFMLPLAVLGPLGRIERLRSIGMLAALLSGIWFFMMAVFGLLR